MKFSVFVVGLGGRFVLKPCCNLKVTPHISVFRQMREVILRTSLERLTVSLTSALLMRKTKFFVPMVREIKIVLTGCKNIAKHIMKHIMEYSGI